MKKLIQPLLLSLVLLPTPLLSDDNAKAKGSDNPLFVTINGVDFTENEVKHFISQMTDVEDPQEAMREMINVELVNQAAKKENLLKDETLQMEIRRTTSALVASTYLQKFMANLQITDEQIEARYRAKYVDGRGTKEFNANHILVETEEEAKAIIQKLGEGTNFEALAKAFSTGPSGKKGGALGWFKKKDMVAPFSAATAELEVGKYSKKPVQTQFGWHVILLNDTRIPDVPELDSVRNNLTNAIATEQFRKKLEDLQKAATIKFH